MVEFRIHDWFKPSCLDGLRVQVPLRVKKLCSSGAMGDTADLGSVALWYVGSSPTLSIMPKWWNGIHSRLRSCRLYWIESSSLSFGIFLYKWRNWDTRLSQTQFSFEIRVQVPSCTSQDISSAGIRAGDF